MKNTLSIQQNASLKSFNTFGVDATTEYLAVVHQPEELIALLSNTEFHQLPKLILGEGSNILFTQHYAGMVIKMAIKGIALLKENEDEVWLKVGAGENWHDFVMYCIQHGYGGVENLSLIPGTVGAAPIQNIGAYGVELKEILVQLEAIQLHNGCLRVFTNQECDFHYRDSIFKNELKQQFAITTVTFCLHKKPALHTEYEVLKNALQQLPAEAINIKTVSDAVIQIRRSKLPDPKVLGNAGSFFKNPIISRERLQILQNNHTTIVPHFAQDAQFVKVHAGWLIEQCGWKGKRLGEVGVYEKQALVLVNYGNGKGTEVLALAKQIQHSVKDRFDILLEPEVNLY